MNSKLGGRIRELRVANDITQEQLAEQIGISRQKYARIENGVNDITLEILTKIAKILEIQVTDITKILDEPITVECRIGIENTSPERFLEMVDLFYANKHLNEKLNREE